MTLSIIVDAVISFLSKLASNPDFMQWEFLVLIYGIFFVFTKIEKKSGNLKKPLQFLLISR